MLNTFVESGREIEIASSDVIQPHVLPILGKRFALKSI